MVHATRGPNITKHVMDPPMSIQICGYFNTILYYISPTVQFGTLVAFGKRYENISCRVCDI